MFCFQAPFESDKQLSRSFLSESEKNLFELSCRTGKILCHSDSNIFRSCGNSGSTKRERWKIKAQMISYPKNVDNYGSKAEEKINEDFAAATKTGSNSLCDLVEHSVPLVQMSPGKTVRNASCETLSPSLQFFRAHDIEFIDESKSGSQENIEVENDCLNSDRKANYVAESQNQKSENYCLQNKMSIINLKAIKNNFTEHSSFSENSEDICEKNISTGADFEHNVNGQNDSKAVAYLNSGFDSNCKNESCSDSNLSKCGRKSLKRQKINSGTSFLSLFSLFSFSKSPSKSTEKMSSRNNETELREPDASIIFQQNILTTSLSCCPLISQKTKSIPVENSEKDAKYQLSNIVVVNKSPKPKNKALFSDGIHSLANDGPLDYKNGSFFSSNSSSRDTSSDGIAPMASPEMISLPDSQLSSPKLFGYSNGKSFREPKFPSSLSVGYAVSSAKLKLLHEGDAQICYLSHSRTIFRKVLSSKLLRRWETHHIYLNDDCLCSKTPIGCFESPVPYSNLDEVYVVNRWDQGNRFCIRLVMAEGSFLIQTSNSLVRDQWLSSILWKKNMHKYRNILQTSTRPEVILKEIKSLIYSSLNSPLQDDCIRGVPIEIISKVLNEDDMWNDRQLTEEVITALAPLLEDSTPSPEMFRFFCRHCLSHPRSPVVVDVFSSIVQRILKRTMDFSKSPLMRRFVADYFKALHSQNSGDEAIRKFIKSVHGTGCGCPHPRVLPNLVAVNLAAVFSHFEQRKMLLTESTNETNCNEALQLLDKQLECFVTLFLTISEYEDWRPGLAQLLQPIPLPDDALSHNAFIKEFIPVIKKIGTDLRCEVHEMVLGIRENKEGWLNVFCPSSLICKDEGILWCQMLKTLFYCCCRRKSFLQKMVKHLGALLLVALRGHAVAQEMLCLMLEWRLLNGEDQEMQIVTTLQSNESGRLKYTELCKRQEHLRELRKEGGPRKLTLPSRSTDADVARLLSCGSFGNLECLSLAFTHVTSACAHQLIQLPALRYLNLWATQFGDAGLVIIAEHLEKLQVLNLCETPVSDKGIAAIAAMRNLKKLNLNSTKLSPHTLDTLKMKLPTLQELDVRYTDAW